MASNKPVEVYMGVYIYLIGHLRLHFFLNVLRYFSTVSFTIRDLETTGETRGRFDRP